MTKHRTMLVLASALTYFALLRRAILTWGATDGEATAKLPGDELLSIPDSISTRAIDIQAPPSAVWPWLAQMGPAPRGGAYTYDWIENLLGLDMHSVDRVLSEFQSPQVGESISFGANAMRFERVDPEHTLVLRSLDGNWVWAFVLKEHASGTRLISRNRFRLPTLIARVGMLPMEPGSLVMERRMLLGIKQRAESLPANGRSTVTSRYVDATDRRWLGNCGGLLAAAVVVPEISYSNDVGTLLLAGAILGLASFALRPLVILLALPAIILSLGIALLFVNALMLWVTSVVVPSLHIGGFWSTFAGALVIWLVNRILRPADRTAHATSCSPRGRRPESRTPPPV